MKSPLVAFSKIKVKHQTLQENALGTKKKILGILYPKNTQEVLQIIKIAIKKKIALYPYSRGQNYGYGAKTPHKENSMLVDLSEMNKIRRFDLELGKVIIEPGVTQAQLYNFLKDTPWMSDVSGAGKASSIIGNCLEGGFGHTPKGNKRKELTNLEVVLGNETILTTGEFPGLGPDLSGLFVQSNFGIITALELNLLRKSEVESFIITFKNETRMLEGMQKIRTLLQKQTLISLVHIGNATRTLSTLKSIQKVTNNQAALMLKKEYGAGDQWNCLGGIYGSKKEIIAKKKQIKDHLRGIGKILFFSKKRLSKLEKLTSALRMHKKRELIKNFQVLHDLLEGKPTDTPLKNMQLEKKHLIWFSPVINAKKSEVKKLLSIGETTLSEFNFSFPLTLTFVTPNKLVGVISLQYQSEEKERAFACYEKLSKECSKQGISQYRKATIGMEEINYDSAKQETLIKLKDLFDPNRIIAPGRYNIK